MAETSSEDREAAPESGWRIDTWVGVAGLVVAVVSTVVATIFALRADRSKALTMWYFAARPLLSVEAQPAQKLQVNVAGRAVSSPWLLSGRLQNTGSQSIEIRDIEKPIQLTFTSGEILNAEIISKSQGALTATISHDAKVVTVQHGLLNPGDWLSFDILFEGQPSYPSASARISGVSEIAQLRVAPGESRGHVSLIALPTPVLYCLLIIATAGPAFVMFLGAALLLETAGNLWGIRLSRRSKRAELTVEAGRDDLAEHVLSHLKPTTHRNRILFAALGGGEATRDWIDEPEALRGAIEEHVPAGVLAAFNVSPVDAAAGLNAELRTVLRDSLARMHREGTPAHQAFLALPAAALTYQQIVAHYRVLTTETHERMLREQPKPRIGYLAFPAVLLICGAALLLFVGGAWRTLLGL